MSSAPYALGVVGARGYVGAELLALLAGHPDFGLALATSREHAGRPVAAVAPGLPAGLAFEALGAADCAARRLDAYVLALPNGQAAEYAAAIGAARPDAVVVDLSADHRFDAAWRYGQPERRRRELAGARRVANPGCYATAMQLALAPLVPRLGGPAHAFGVSGHSGAGSAPSPRNDPARLRDNLLPYALVGHVHEREVSHQLGVEVSFSPHVAPFFRGLSVTVQAPLRPGESLASVDAAFREAYGGEPLVRYLGPGEPPSPRDAASRHDVTVGGLAVAGDGRRVGVVAALDNLLAGAATQALRNLNLAFGLPENRGVPASDGGGAPSPDGGGDPSPDGGRGAP
ncbi:MAG TPA: N-acetyl-gamma-glutamyl-phosphate reductase, partial [Polyangiaceae bacterium]|nr:N-acetyl-gamma-glutamyl-phosphate reductase [Polyangiaceae bacterium]